MTFDEWFNKYEMQRLFGPNEFGYTENHLRECWNAAVSSSMNFYELSQIKHRDTELFAHHMIVRAPDENVVRQLAQENEDNYRDGELNWTSSDNASCNLLTTDGPAEVCLVA